VPSKLGTTLRNTRNAKGIGLRQLARRIKKSPALLTRLECDDEIPAILPETLRAIAHELEMDADKLLLLAKRAEAPVPQTTLDMALYRKVIDLTKVQKERLLKELEDK